MKIESINGLGWHAISEVFFLIYFGFNIKIFLNSYLSQITHFELVYFIYKLLYSHWIDIIWKNNLWCIFLMNGWVSGFFME